VLFSWWRRRRRTKLRAEPFPPAWLEVLQELPLYRRLNEDDQAELRGHLQVFLAEKSFEGCGGQTIDDQVRVTIGAQACLLLLHRETEYYPGLSSILVYPTTYQASHEELGPGGVVTEGTSHRHGESWTRGEVVLAWDSVQGGAQLLSDGENVTLHEFAHQLDQEDGRADGAPILASRSAYGPWAQVLSHGYEELKTAVERGRRDTIDSYGATNPAEFFAVITEAFFERPRQLRRKHPELYEQLARFYRQDPAEQDPSKARD
jgi:MtfA peptidase